MRDTGEYPVPKIQIVNLIQDRKMRSSEIAISATCDVKWRFFGFCPELLRVIRAFNGNLSFGIEFLRLLTYNVRFTSNIYRYKNLLKKHCNEFITTLPHIWRGHGQTAKKSEPSFKFYNTIKTIEKRDNYKERTFRISPSLRHDDFTAETSNCGQKETVETSNLPTWCLTSVTTSETHTLSACHTWYFYIYIYMYTH